MVGINVGHKDNEKLNWIETTYRYYVINDLLINCDTKCCSDFVFFLELLMLSNYEPLLLF